MDPLYGALIVGLLSCAAFTLPHIRDRNRARRELRATCRHTTWRHFNAMNDPTFPIRQCDRCGKQEHLTRCLECGRTLTRRSHIDQG